MTTTTRILNNSGSPLSDPAGNILANKNIVFTLTDSNGNPVDAFDALTAERVVGVVSTTTDVNGLFSVNLWPNDRGIAETFYSCSLDHPGAKTFMAAVPSGAAPLRWLDFRLSGAPLSAAAATALDAHIANANVHLVPNLANSLKIPQINAAGNGIDYIPASAMLLPGMPLNGFLNPAEVTVSWNNATRTLTLTPVGASFRFYVNDVLFTKVAAESFVISNITGNHYIYYNDSGVLAEMTTFVDDLIARYAFASSLYWNAATSLVVPDAVLEMHGCGMPAAVHLYLHYTQSAKYDLEIAGLTPAVTSEGNGSLLSHIQVAATNGAIWDDDVRHLIEARTLAQNIPVLYRTGASGIWTFDESSSAIVKTTGTGRAAYNQWTGTTWQLTEVANANFALAHLIAIGGITKKWVILMGTNEYGSLAAARDAAANEITTLTGFPFAEHKDIATFVIQTSNSYTNAVKSRIREISAGIDFIDWRMTEVGVPGSSANVVIPKMTTAEAAALYSVGGIYFDTTMNKLRIGGASAWETVTSV